jgi:glycosyltransferase involved in cell wall biosynthesis
MKIIVHSQYNAGSIGSGLGKAEYSYYFVLTGFLPALRALGTVVQIENPLLEADAIFDACQQSGEACVLLCFAPPYQIPITLRCPTIPVIAWEFSTIPCEAWGDDPRSDWRVVFAHCGRVITLSRHTARLVQDAMGVQFPVFAIPTASYDAFSNFAAATEPVLTTRDIRFRGFLFDSAADGRFTEVPLWAPVLAPALPAPVPEPAAEHIVEAVAEPVTEPVLDPFAARRSARARLALTVHHLRAWYRDVLRDILPRPVASLLSLGGRSLYRAYRLALPLPAALPAPVAAPVPPPAPAEPVWPEHDVRLNGVVYVSVLAPQDGRKNWHDLVSGFVWTFRDNPKVTLVLKMPLTGGLHAYPAMRALLARFAPFQCRIVFLVGFLDDADYHALVQATTYYVNTSHCEGLCLPLMEFLSAGKPAIAPDHTAMGDYITEANAFVLQGSLEHNVWPHDPRDLFTTMRYRLNWQSLSAGFETSYRIAMANDKIYAAMSLAAQNSMRAFCSVDVVRGELADALERVMPCPAPLHQEAGMVTA